MLISKSLVGLQFSILLKVQLSSNKRVAFKGL
jgi:hypothetical protein